MQALLFSILVLGPFCFASDFDTQWRESEMVRRQETEARLNQWGRAKAQEHLASIPRFARMMKQQLVEGSVQCNEGDASMNHGAYYSCDFKTTELSCRVKSGSSRGGIIHCDSNRRNCRLVDASWNFACVDGNRNQILKSLPARL